MQVGFTQASPEAPSSSSIEKPEEGNSPEIKSYSEKAYSCGSDALGFFGKQLKNFACGAVLGVALQELPPLLLDGEPTLRTRATYSRFFKSNPEYQAIYRNSQLSPFLPLATIMSIAQGYSNPGISANTRVLPKEVVVVNMIALAVIKSSIHWLEMSVVDKISSLVFRKKTQTGGSYQSIFKKAMLYFVLPLLSYQLDRTNELMNTFYIPRLLFDDFGFSGLIGSNVLDVSLEAAHFLTMIKPNLSKLIGTA